MRVVYVAVGAVVAIPVVYLLLAAGGRTCNTSLTLLFCRLVVMLMVEGTREGQVARDRTIARCLTTFTFNIMFWMFFEQAGSSSTFSPTTSSIALGGPGGRLPHRWFRRQLVAVVALALVMAYWVYLAKRNSTRRFHGSSAWPIQRPRVPALIRHRTSWTSTTRSVLTPFQFTSSIGELCLPRSSMVTKLAPVKLVGLGMGGWFLSTAIGNNLSGIFASVVSGEGGMTTASALSGYTFGFWALLGAGVILLVVAPMVNKLMHGVK
jgi:POT family proton-dependent oligopeptide transporter